MGRIIFAISLIAVCVLMAVALVILTKRETEKVTGVSDIDQIKRWAKKIRVVCKIVIVLVIIGTVAKADGLVVKINEKTFTTSEGITMQLQEETNANGEKTYVGKYIDDEGKEIIYNVSEPNNDTSGAWEELLQILIDLVVLSAVLGCGINILNKISKDGIPFTELIAKKLLLIGIILLTSGIIKQTVVATIIFVLGLWMPTSNIMLFNLDLASILTGLLIYLISVIFMYGCRLQRTEDELI